MIRQGFLYLCMNEACETGTFRVVALRRRAGVICPSCHGSAEYFAVEAAMTRAEWDHAVATISKPHGEWLKIVDHITRRWLMAEIVYADSHDGPVAMAFTPVNDERYKHGLPPLTWEDVSDEAQKL